MPLLAWVKPGSFDWAKKIVNVAHRRVACWGPGPHRHQPERGCALILLCHLLQCPAGKCQSAELGNRNEKTTETELNKLHPDLTVGPMVSGMLGTDITPGRGREICGLLGKKPAEAGSLRCPFGCGHLFRATQLSPIGQSKGSRARDSGCPWSWCPSFSWKAESWARDCGGAWLPALQKSSPQRVLK